VTELILIDLVTARAVSRIVAVVLLGVMVAATAGPICLSPVLRYSNAHSSMAGCQHAPIPSRPQPADYRCCISRHPVGLAAKVSSPLPVMQPVQASFCPVSVAVACNAFPVVAVSPGSPPGVVTLRI